MGAKVLIGITSKNRAPILPKAIQSALDQQCSNKEIAVFDDASTDGTYLLEKDFPQVHWTISKEPRGLMYARNYFLTISDAAYFCSLDDDAWFLSNDRLQTALEYMEKQPKVAALAFKILSPDDTNENTADDKVTETNNFIGCGHLLRVSAVNAIGKYILSPGNYGGEEKDLCIRLMNQGYSIMRFPAVRVWHDKTTLARDQPFQHRSGVCNDLVFMWRRTPLLYLFPSLIVKLYKHFIFSRRYKKSNLKKACMQGFGDFFKALFSGRIKRDAVTVKTFKRYLSFNQ